MRAQSRNVCDVSRRRWIAIRDRAAFCLTLGATLLIGCGTGEQLPETAPVTGTVLLDSEPVEGATVMFHPQDAEATNPGIGFTGPDGRFVLTTFSEFDGALIGTHVVTVQLFDPVGVVRSVPAKYGDPKTSGLTATVDPEGSDIPVLLVASE